MEPDAVDLAGAVMGVVEHGLSLGPSLVAEGDVVVGLVSPNLRSNGFSLVRALFGDDIESQLDRFLEPSVIYSPAVLRAVEGGGVQAAAHITGGGIAGNLARVLPPGMGAHLDTGAWEVPPVFETVAVTWRHPMPRCGPPSTWGSASAWWWLRDAAESVMSAVSAHEGRVIGEIVVGEGVALG